MNTRKIILLLVISLNLAAGYRAAAQMFSDSIGFRIVEDDGQAWNLKVYRDTIWQHNTIPLSRFGNGSDFLNTPVTKFTISPIGGGGLIGGPLIEVVDWIDALFLADSLIDDFDDGVYTDWFWDIALNGSYLHVTSSTNTPDSSPRCIQLAHGNTMGQSFAGYVEKRFTGLSLSPNDTLRFWVRGKSHPVVSIPDVRNEIPLIFALHRNYPNPVNPRTIIKYQIPSANHVTLKVFDILGREVATLVNEIQDAGYKSVLFDASRLASGMYFYQLKAGSFTGVKKMVLVK